MDGSELMRYVVGSIEVQGLEVGDRLSDVCIQHTIEHLCCQGCVYEKGCTCFVTVIWNMLRRHQRGEDVDRGVVELEIQKQVALAKAGIMPQRED